LLWYYYSLSWYARFIYGGIRLSLCHHRRDEYISALFKGCWKHSQKKWFLVDMHVQPSWENKLLFPPVITAQRKEPPMNACLAALVLDDRCLGKSIGSRLLFICGTVHVKSVRYMSKGRQSVPLAFCMRCYTCKKHKIDEEGTSIGSPLLFVCGAVKSII
jgi:hypothetical protein